MSTKDSPLWKLKAESAKMAKHLKAADLDKLAPGKTRIKIGLIMDDKTIKFDINKSHITSLDEATLADWLLNYMREYKPS